MNRKQLILMALLIILVLCVTYAYLAMPRLEKAPPRAQSKRSEPSEKTATASADENLLQRVLLEKMTFENREFPGAERDIFNYKQRLRQAPTVKPPVVKPPIREVLPRKVVNPPVEELQRTLSRFTFLGFLDKGGEKTVFLSSGGSLFTVKQGERFGNNSEFLVAEIDNEVLTVQGSDESQNMKVPLIENQLLQPIISSPARAESRPDIRASQPLIRRPFSRRPGPIIRTGEEETLPELEQDMLQDETFTEGSEAAEGETNVERE